MIYLYFKINKDKILIIIVSFKKKNLLLHIFVILKNLYLDNLLFFPLEILFHSELYYFRYKREPFECDLKKSQSMSSILLFKMKLHKHALKIL